jgi:hypothetical protein
MITFDLEKVDYKTGVAQFGFTGLSTDTKPTVKHEDTGYLIANGSSFLEMDTGDLAFYDKDTDNWVMP